MGALFQLTLPDISPAPGTRILPAADAATLVEAGEAIAAAQARGRDIIREAHASCEAIREEAHKKGLEQGRQAHSEKMLETVMLSVAFIERMEKSLGEIVGSAVRKIIMDMPPEERMAGVVKKALAGMRGHSRVVVRVSPEDEPAVRRALEPMLTATPGAASFLEVAADARVERNACLLESELGTIDASLETQLRALDKALSVKINYD